MKETVQVTREDREAAAGLWEELNRQDGLGRNGAAWRDGSRDKWALVQAFARHRLSATSAPAGVEASAVTSGQIAQFDADDMIAVPRGLLAAAAYCVRKHTGPESETYKAISAAALAATPAPSDQDASQAQGEGE